MKPVKAHQYYTFTDRSRAVLLLLLLLIIYVIYVLFLLCFPTRLFICLVFDLWWGGGGVGAGLLARL